MNAPPLVLASRSPRRHRLLTQLGVPFEVLDASIDERLVDGEGPVPYAERLAREKALAGWESAGSVRPSLGADTIVVLGDEVLLKPESPADAGVCSRP